VSHVVVVLLMTVPRTRRSPASSSVAASNDSLLIEVRRPGQDRSRELGVAFPLQLALAESRCQRRDPERPESVIHRRLDAGLNDG
jgi:hypothetical protein